MSSASCGRCGSPAPEALLRNVSLHVDGSEVDAQTICPDCFSDWIAHYQEQMAGDMPGADDEAGDMPGAGGNSDAGDDDALSEAIRAAQEHVESDGERGATEATPPGEASAESAPSGGDEIREVGGGSPAGGHGDADPGGEGGVDVDLGGDADVAEEDDEDDDGGLLLG